MYKLLLNDIIKIGEDMKDKKGFTLVELLAVIAILAILVIIALPNVMGMFNEAKENSFMTEIKQIYKTAQQTWMMDSMFSTNEMTYSRCNGCSSKSLDLSGRTELEYYIKISQSGSVVEFYATDGTYQYSYSGNGLAIEDISKVVSVAEITNEADKLTITDNMNSNAARFCVTNGGQTNYYDFERGMTWSTYLSSRYNDYFDEYHDHNTPRGIVSTRSGATSYCGTDMLDNYGTILITSQIKESSSGCYIYNDPGIC